MTHPEYTTICSECNYHGTGSNMCPGIKLDEEMRIKDRKVQTYFGSDMVRPSIETTARCPMSRNGEDPVQAMLTRSKLK